MAKYGITPQQGRIIRFLALKNEEAIFQKDIENFLNIRKSSVSNIIKNMEKTGFIIRSQVPNDARLKRIELTPAGRAIHEDAQLNNLMIEAKMRENLSEQEIEILEMILKKIQSNLEN
jgi:DNA-binding MarR family transcriptional regulator